MRILKTGSQLLACKLTNEEHLARAHRLADTISDQAAELSRQDLLKKEMKSREAAIVAERDRLGVIVSRGEEMREVPTETRADDETGKVLVVRLDTNQTVEERMLLGHERQTDLGLPLGDRPTDEDGAHPSDPPTDDETTEDASSKDAPGAPSSSAEPLPLTSDPKLAEMSAEEAKQHKRNDTAVRKAMKGSKTYGEACRKLGIGCQQGYEDTALVPGHHPMLMRAIVDGAADGTKPEPTTE